MKTLEVFAQEATPSLSMVTAMLLTDLAEARGRQDLYTQQSPSRLQKLRENALVESAVSSNRIEGVEVDRSRIGTLVHGTSHVRDRDEAEVRGYRDALKLIHESGANLPINEETILRLHRLCRGDIWDAGQYKDRDVDIIQRYPDGRSRVRFVTVKAAETPAAMAKLGELFRRGWQEKWAPPLLLVAGHNLDFLCIHPFRDGNGRVSRLLLLLGLYHCGFEVGRYVSIERLVEEHKERYYETLEQCSQRWHEGRHNPWPYTNFLLFIIGQAYKEFEQRLGRIAVPRGEKSALVEEAIRRRSQPFRVSDLASECPGVGIDTIRQVLRRLRGTEVECLGRGQHAQWRRLN